MKDVDKLKNYRTKYKRYYGIDFGSDYVIHHNRLDMEKWLSERGGFDR